MSTAEPPVAPDLPAALGPASIPQLTIGGELAHVAPGRTWMDLCRWPPDAFAATSAVLADSGAYRCVVCPPAGKSWPPTDGSFEGEPWEISIRRWGVEWASWAARSPDEAGHLQRTPPEHVSRFAAILDEAVGTSLSELDDPSAWSVTTAILTLHAMADEASADVGIAAETDFQRLAAAQLAVAGSLARLPADRVRVLPKMRPPESGITLRSLSHHLAFDRSEVQTRWLMPPSASGTPKRPPPTRLTLLLIPYPTQVHTRDFRPIRGTLQNMDQSRFGFYEYAPSEPFDPSEIIGLVAAARHSVGAVDAVVLPEAALDEMGLPTLHGLLSEAGVPYLITGVRRPGNATTPFGRNYAYIGGDGWCAAAQHKHHRWCLSPGQVHQYHLGASLDPTRRWWEAIAIERRSLTFVAVPDCRCLTICPLVCEDLARPDPVTDVIRAVAPTLLVGLLLDGPQLASRWAARYASVLADDPGCSVLTLTALGMAWRSQPPGFAPSRVIGLWKDPDRGLQEIVLGDGARAVALTAHLRGVVLPSADGRCSARPVSQLVLSGLEQIA